MPAQNQGPVWVSWPGGVGAPTKVPIGGGKRKATRKNRKAAKKSRKAAKKSRGTRRR